MLKFSYVHRRKSTKLQLHTGEKPLQLHTGEKPLQRTFSTFLLSGWAKCSSKISKLMIQGLSGEASIVVHMLSEDSVGL